MKIGGRACLPGMQGTLGSIPSTARKHKRKGRMGAGAPGTQGYGGHQASVSLRQRYRISISFNALHGSGGRLTLCAFVALIKLNGWRNRGK